MNRLSLDTTHAIAVIDAFELLIATGAVEVRDQDSLRHVVAELVSKLVMVK